MELKFVVPNMEKTFGNLEYAGESEVVQRRINGRVTAVSRSYNLYSDVQRADDIIAVSYTHLDVYKRQSQQCGQMRASVQLQLCSEI